jgi:hypothetical protein
MLAVHDEVSELPEGTLTFVKLRLEVDTNENENYFVL